MHLLIVKFFIGDLGDKEILNSITTALLNRIMQAIDADDNFKVIIVIPMHPEGDFVGSEGPRYVMHYQASTICRYVSF
jgi:hypothetical protein